MKSRILLSLLAVTLMAAGASMAQAIVDVQLNLRYTDPADEAAGGSWDLLVQTDSAFGVAGLVVNITGDLGVTGVDTPGAQIVPNSAAFDNTTSVFRYNLLTGGDAEIVAGDDLAGALVVGVGTIGQAPGNAANVAEDDLFDDQIASNQPWDDSSLIASGTFLAGSVRPVLSVVLANEFDSLTTVASTLATIGDVSVRGDAAIDLSGAEEMLLGDANRDGDVTIADFSALQNNFNQAGKVWNEGDFNSTGDVTIADFSALQNNFNGSASDPPLSAGLAAAVPEPSTMVLISVLSCLSLSLRRRA